MVTCVVNPKKGQKGSNWYFMLIERWKPIVKGICKWIIPLWNRCLWSLKFWHMFMSSTQNWLEKGPELVSYVLMVIKRWKSKVKVTLKEAVVQNYSVKKVFLEIPQNSHENTSARVSFLINLQALGLRPATLLKRRLWHTCFPVNFVKFLRTPIFIEHIWWLRLHWGEVFVYETIFSKFWNSSPTLHVIISKLDQKDSNL